MKEGFPVSIVTAGITDLSYVFNAKGNLASRKDGIAGYKDYIILFFLLSLSFRLVAQDISIEFSIEWGNKLNFQFEKFKDENIRPAFLNITYRNVSNAPLYCLKITDNRVGLPEVGSFYTPHITYPTEKFPYYDYNYHKRRYFVDFQSNSTFSIGFTWDVYNDTTDMEYRMIEETLRRPIVDIVGHDVDGNPLPSNDFGRVIGDMNEPLHDGIALTLNGIYNYIYRHYYPEMKDKIGKDGNEQLYHYSTDITKDTIMNNSINKFVFLKPGETYVDKYNLIGFQITGGTFTFQLDDTKSLDYVETGLVNEAKFGTARYLRKQLPLKVGEYELFTGEFLTNKVTVYFPGIKVKE
jgi:hypothetical protein